MWAGGIAGLALLGWGMGTGAEVPGAERRQDANLIATRGSAPVSRWVVAHLDTKAQGHSMAGRLIAVWLLAAAVLILGGISVARAVLGQVLPAAVVAAAAGLALTAGTLAARGRLRGTSPGARDNGTGVLAALVAAGISRDPATGFLFTGAEEFGLVGARAFAGSHDVRGAEIINLDTLSDNGRLYLVCHDRAGATLAEDLAPRLAQGGREPSRRRLPLGILTDSLPLARAGGRAVTVARLGWPALRLMHTAADAPEGLDLATAEAVGQAVGRLPRAGARDGIDQSSGPV